MTRKSETAPEYPASLVVAMLSAIKRQMISDAAIRVGELHCAGQVPDEGDYPTELERKWEVDGTGIDPKLLIKSDVRENYTTKPPNFWLLVLTYENLSQVMLSYHKLGNISCHKLS